MYKIGVCEVIWCSHYPERLSLENSGFSQVCRKAMEWLSDDTTHFHYSL